jgi:hypothetical protein
MNNGLRAFSAVCQGSSLNKACQLFAYDVKTYLLIVIKTDISMYRVFHSISKHNVGTQSALQQETDNAVAFAISYRNTNHYFLLYPI